MADDPPKARVTFDEKRVDEFALAEFGAVREEILMIIGRVGTLENTALVTSGAIWLWVATSPALQPYLNIIIWLPLLLSVLFLVNREALRRSLRTAADQIGRIEDHLLIPDNLAWQRYLDNNKAHHFKLWRNLYWFLLIAFNVVAPVYLWNGASNISGQ